LALMVKTILYLLSRNPLEAGLSFRHLAPLAAALQKRIVAIPSKRGCLSDG